MSAHALDVLGLSKRFTLHIRGGLVIEGLQSATFQVRRGEFTGLVGRSGSGKSTLLKCLFRTYLPDGGSARPTSGHDVRLLSTGELRCSRFGGRLGYVSQALRVIPRVTVEGPLPVRWWPGALCGRSSAGRLASARAEPE
jgi:alpha-D-ribose 1-methylphosphonate 5-triphosphate synthase subunit PhnL